MLSVFKTVCACVLVTCECSSLQRYVNTLVRIEHYAQRKNRIQEVLTTLGTALIGCLTEHSFHIQISTGDVLNANSGIVRDSSNVSIGRDTAPAPPSSAPGTRPSRSRSTREKGERDRDGPRRFSHGEHATNKPPR